MSTNKVYQSLVIGVAVVLSLFLSVAIESNSLAQMSSDNYKLCTSVLSEGGRVASSTNFKAITTIGQPSPIGNVADSSYIGYYGFWYEIVAQEEVGIEDRTASTASNLPKVFSLSQNHPNPFNPITQIKYALPRDCRVRLDVYNTIGQKVATLIDGEQKAGYKTVRWDAGSFASGIYFYRLQAGDFVETKKMILLR